MNKTYTLNEISKFPKVAYEITSSILNNHTIKNVKPGWYCIPVINGLPMISQDILIIAIRQQDLSIAVKAAMVHNTYDGKMSQDEAIALQAGIAGIGINEYFF